MVKLAYFHKYYEILTNNLKNYILFLCMIFYFNLYLIKQKKNKITTFVYH